MKATYLGREGYEHEGEWFERDHFMVEDPPYERTVVSNIELVDDMGVEWVLEYLEGKHSVVPTGKEYPQPPR